MLMPSKFLVHSNPHFEISTLFQGCKFISRLKGSISFTAITMVVKVCLKANKQLYLAAQAKAPPH